MRVPVRSGKKIAGAALLSLLALATSGCSSLGVQPWEREVLARPEMTFGYASVSRALEDHVYFSKEASSGGRGFGGGGCGCN